MMGSLCEAAVSLCISRCQSVRELLPWRSSHAAVLTPLLPPLLGRTWLRITVNSRAAEMAKGNKPRSTTLVQHKAPPAPAPPHYCGPIAQPTHEGIRCYDVLTSPPPDGRSSLRIAVDLPQQPSQGVNIKFGPPALTIGGLQLRDRQEKRVVIPGKLCQARIIGDHRGQPLGAHGKKTASW